MAENDCLLSTSGKVLDISSINPYILRIQNPVRKPLIRKAHALEEQLKNNSSSTFHQIIRGDLGDSHAMGQCPITFFRQVIACLSFPRLLEDVDFPSDVIERVKRFLSSCEGQSIGSYTDSLGIKMVREDIADFLARRDGIPSEVDNIFLSSGASEAIEYILRLISTGLDGDQRAGVMVPIPQYTLYPATVAEFNMFQISYYLDEEHNWDVNIQELTRALTEARGNCIPRALVVVNPGNPTGQILSREAMERTIRFAIQNHLVLLADEVYQINAYRPWISFKQVLHDMGPSFADRLEMASFMTCSKGYMGECGFRGGFCELTNIDPLVRSQLYKALSVRLCPSVLGQAMVDCIVNPPKEHEPSYAMFCTERDAVLDGLRYKADLITQSFAPMRGLSCTPIQGAMYALPRITLPPKAIKAAQDCEQHPDYFYCERLLEETGICLVPGSDFGQAPDTHHFRITLLPPVGQLKYMLERLKEFHESFTEKYTS